MAQHRIKLGKADCQSDDQAKFQELFSIIKNENLIEKYRNKLPKDPLTKLLSYL